MACYGDYDTSCQVERANNRYLTETYPAWFNMISGAYSSVACCITDETIDGLDWNNEDIQDTAAEIIDILNHLAGYPVIDEKVMSEVENEMIDEVIKNCYARDVQRAIEQRFNGGIEISEEKAGELIREFAVNGLEPHFEMGGNVYIDIDVIIPCIMEYIDENSMLIYEGTIPQSVIDAIERNNGTLCPIDWLPVAHFADNDVY